MVAVYSSIIFSGFEFRICITVYSQVFFISSSVLLNLFLVQALIWWASSEIKTIFLSLKSPKVMEFSLKRFNWLCSPCIVVKIIFISSPFASSKLDTSLMLTSLSPNLILWLKRYLGERGFKKLSLVFSIMLVLLTKNRKFL